LVVVFHICDYSSLQFLVYVDAPLDTSQVGTYLPNMTI